MLKHLSVHLNLDNPEDRAIYEFLKPHTETYRGGDMIRRALLQMIQQPVGYPVPAIPPRLVWTPPPTQATAAVIPRVVESGQLIQKARKAFFK